MTPSTPMTPMEFAEVITADLSIDERLQIIQRDRAAEEAVIRARHDETTETDQPLEEAA